MRRKYERLDEKQKDAIRTLGGFFNPSETTAERTQLAESEKEIPSGYTRAIDRLSPKGKKALDEHEHNIQEGFNQYSAY